MVRIWLIFISSFFSVLFLFYRPIGEFCFKYYDCLPIDTVIYLAYEHIGLILLALALLLMDSEYKLFFQLFLFIQIIDFVMFALFYRSPSLFGIPWNATKNVILGVPLIVYTWKALRHR